MRDTENGTEAHATYLWVPDVSYRKGLLFNKATGSTPLGLTCKVSAEICPWYIACGWHKLQVIELCHWKPTTQGRNRITLTVGSPWRMFHVHILRCGTDLAHLNPRELQLEIPDNEPQVTAHFAPSATFRRVLQCQEGYSCKKKILQGCPVTLSESYFI